MYVTEHRSVSLHDACTIHGACPTYAACHVARKKNDVRRMPGMLCVYKSMFLLNLVGLGLIMVLLPMVVIVSRPQVGKWGRCFIGLPSVFPLEQIVEQMEEVDLEYYNNRFQAIAVAAGRMAV